MKKVIVVGNGMVGYKFCEKLAAHADFEGFEVIVFGEEPRPAYDRVHLSEYFADKSAEELLLAPANWYTDHQIELRTSELVTQIDLEDKKITTHKDTVFEYDYLILATGSAPFVPPIKGSEKAGVFVYRTIEDLDAMKSYAAKLKAKGKKSAAVLGGGLLGLEAANAAKELGMDAHVVEFAQRLMPRQLDQGASDMLQSKIEELGIGIHLSKATEEIMGDGAIERMDFADDTHLDADMLIISAGIRPRDELARASGLQVGARGGIYVNEKMQTSDSSVYAIGEVALYNEGIYGLVAPGYEMADVAVEQITGGEKAMAASIDMSTQLKLIGTEVASFGDPFVENHDVVAITYENKQRGIYKRINVAKDGSRLFGGILVGDSSDYNTLFQIYYNAMKLPENPEDLILGSRGGESILGSVLDLPDTAQICSCESVSKGEICEAIQDGTAANLKDIVKCTKATTGCGGCKPMVVDLVNETLKSLGKEVKDTICEHFEYSRQELYDLVKVKQITTFEEALARLGKGCGCEVCKPVMASIFSSIYMETANKQPVIQDSNDRFLANIQRNGTYSVVPRVAGGEISPQKLIVLGEVAKKYDLYTKITGGQRIDLFGAQLHELPLIWKELIDAGFESGHAYGKSLRTVKSCVGSTWCRYGMHESVTFAIEIENRYRGLRSPHKLKGGVSGCIRECAEARGKDFGLIAVDGGWNLYVCGNGGATPKHAILLAEQLDDETCVKYLDRFLMFYIRTAAPLMRTAPWLDKLEGGIEYLKKVVVEDSLGIAEELELEMQGLVNKYECEWKQAIEDPEMMGRFKHFVNSDETDETIEFVSLRDQKMPKPW
ncbi:nitrite reductase (NADH) large subunit [Leeuwenhoekiella aestuarii]|uniref:Nitrite reductase (NADH) large subunit n=1 Tax=Leeuwenhoekiella aestuarii TaxID=2249426 RepID=A0A4Q0NT76_9FLAO|nr:nitrite reductase large subunit NirB [Leeuwenhoekiella aestuarii]RXG14279.1 nitrite reductase (NADH) large subunit [Leeuwenhoekiella aestuarii]RXG19028.1 nitrite reductase (NADH) large subunit [Leeuwenhoekiella aestuarii]